MIKQVLKAYGIFYLKENKNAYKTFARELVEQNDGLNRSDSNDFDVRYVGLKHLNKLDNINFLNI